MTASDRKEALFYKKLAGKNKLVKCELCPRLCVIVNGKTGFCRVRMNSDGVLRSLVYGLPVTIAMDPVEKKPLFHFAPGSRCLSLATVGCNLCCKFCQNASISQEYGAINGEQMEPREVVALAKSEGADGIAYTYTEPTVFYEYALDIMKLAKKAGLYNVWVSNGYTNPLPIKKMARYLDAVNVDLKGNDEFYKKVCGGIGIAPVFEALKAYKKNGVWVEVTNLIIPGYNDSDKAIANLVEWIGKNLGTIVPLHFSAFYPQYKLTNAPATPAATLERAVAIARKKGMKWVYAGNVYGNRHESTWCWKCDTLVIKRAGFDVLSLDFKCPKCGERVELKGMKWTRSGGA
ncbi:MAG: AmmeMemoRadiSam system radical SAM enzyme [Candidatus Aenigmarchaeota archaeon]|nr:AmmeMemoRadiSam system radical SAM enzyme [Candidatus Aenigmarchaeota archaeon]